MLPQQGPGDKKKMTGRMIRCKWECTYDNAHRNVCSEEEEEKKRARHDSRSAQDE